MNPPEGQDFSAGKQKGVLSSCSAGKSGLGVCGGAGLGFAAGGTGPGLSCRQVRGGDGGKKERNGQRRADGQAVCRAASCTRTRLFGGQQSHPGFCSVLEGWDETRGAAGRSGNAAKLLLQGGEEK